MFPEFGHGILEEAAVKECSKGRDAMMAKMLDHFVAYACRATGFAVRQLGNDLENFIISYCYSKRSIPCRIDMRKWKIVLFPKVMKECLINRFICSLVKEM